MVVVVLVVVVVVVVVVDSMQTDTLKRSVLTRPYTTEAHYRAVHLAPLLITCPFFSILFPHSFSHCPPLIVSLIRSANE